jgi:hypothetical protein
MALTILWVSEKLNFIFLNHFVLKLNPSLLLVSGAIKKWSQRVYTEAV